jgi:general stress protein 26
MLSADGAPAVPMTHHVDDENDTPVIWFITNRKTDLGQSANSGAAAQYLLASKDENFYARIDGHLARSANEAELDRIWSAFSAAWFEDGRKDDDIELMRFDLTEAEVWITAGNLKFLFEVAKANASESLPDAGTHTKLTF